MHWDEEVFGLELDLERFMIVAVSDFNAGRDGEQGPQHLQHQVHPGARRHRDRHRLLRRRQGRGARVLPQLDRQPRDLPRLVPALAQGRPHRLPRPGIQRRRVLARRCARIQDVRDLRARQFPEDAGPMAHPVRPDSYVEINNFYTATVYDKGAEVVRMYATHARQGRLPHAAWTSTSSATTARP